MKQLANKIVMLTDDSRSPAAEAYRTLRTNIQYTGIDNPIKKLLVTGPSPGCGKTTTLVNLGLALAQAGASVLLVDTDLRKPALHKLFRFRNKQGLTNYLIDAEVSPEMVIYESFIKNVSMLGSGLIPPNPSELLSTDRFKGLVKALSQSFDYLLFDSPPINAVTDAAILSQQVDATLFVVRHGQVTKAEAVFALEQLKKVEANVIGAVMNALPLDDGAYYYYEYRSEENRY